MSGHRPRTTWPFLVINTAILTAIVLALAVAVVTAPPTFSSPGRPSQAAGTIWVTAIAAVGTLGAVWAALHIAREGTETEERRRHDAVRPIIVLQYYWKSGELIYFTATNESQNPALGFYAALALGGSTVPEMPFMVQGPEGREKMLMAEGILLRPFQWYEQTPKATPTIGLKNADPRVNPSHEVDIICEYSDALGWRWSHRVVVPLLDRTHVAGYDQNPFVLLDLGKPTLLRVT